MNKNDYASITWTINNFRYYWQKKDEAIISPMFCIYMPEETKWKLLLFPRGTSDDNAMAFYLYRDKDCNGGETINVKYSLGILTTDSSPWVDIPKTDEFQKGMRKGSDRYADIITGAKRYIQEDNLIIRCKMIQLEDKAVKMPQVFARTIIGVEEQFLQWPIVNFSNLAPNQTESFAITSESKEVKMKIYLVLMSGKEESICFSIYSFDQRNKFSAVKVFIIDAQKQNVDCGEFEYWFNSRKYTMLTLKFTKKQLIENKSLYLPDDVLTLRFQLTVSTGFIFEGIENTVRECSPQSFPNEVAENWRKCISHKKIDDCPCALITELTSLYKEQNLCDRKLKTKTNNFPVHTAILGARSPVFRAMFSTDMKEKVNGCVDASDLEDETVRRFLLYLYSDQLEDLKWDDALKLYKAADKYAVISLRDKCSSFLKRQLSLENACETLMHSDLHEDKDLKEIVQNFILENGKVIFKSVEWKLLGDANSKLAMETMLRNWNEE